MSVERDPIAEPWLGLDSYGEEHSPLFFGRRREVRELLRRIERGVLTVLFGASGTGKTSLLRAGAFPALRAAGYLPIWIRLEHGGQEPHARHVRRLLEDACSAEGIERLAVCPPLAAEGETLWELLHRVELWSPRNRPVTPLFVLDQFEELFTLGEGRAASAAFLTELADLVENYVPAVVRARLGAGRKLAFPSAGQPYKVVLSLREDYVARLDELRSGMPSVMQNRMLLRRMNGTQALEAVLGPGRELVEEDVAREIVSFVASSGRADGEGDEGRGEPQLEGLTLEPALLSVVCRELDLRRREHGEPRITHERVEEARADVLDDFYERGFAGLQPATRAFVEERLLTASGLRGTVPLEEATSAGLPAADLRALVDRRLVRQEERLGIPHLELTHDVLTPVVRASRDGRREREERAAREAELQRARRSRGVFAAIAGVMFLLGLLAFRAWQDAVHKAELIRSYSTVLAVPEMVDPLEGARRLCSVEALGDQVDAFAAYRTAHGLLEQPFPRAVLRGHHGEVRDVAVSPDGATIATVSMDGDLRLWTAEGEPLRVCSGHSGPVRALAFSPDGKLVATASSDRSVGLWTVDGSRPPRLFAGHAHYVLSVRFRPDGSQLASASADGTVRLWDVGQGTCVAVLGPGDAGGRGGHRPDAWVWTAEYDSTGTLLVSASMDGSVRLWDARGGAPLAVLRANEGQALRAIFLPGDRSILSAHDNQRAGIWNVDVEGWRPDASGEVEVDRAGPECFFFGPDDVGLGTRSASFAHSFFACASPSGERIVTTSSSGPLLVWSGRDPRTGLWSEELLRAEHVLEGHVGAVWQAVFDGEERILSVSDDRTARLWDAVDGNCLAVLGGHRDRIRRGAFGPGGRMLCASGDGTVRLWDEPRDARSVDPGGGAIGDLAVSPDGSRWAVGCADGSARVLDAEPGGGALSLAGHQGPVTEVAFSERGDRLLTGSEDGSLCVWNLAGECLARLGSGPRGPSRARFSRDGTLVVAGPEGDSSGPSFVWQLPGPGTPGQGADETGPESLLPPLAELEQPLCALLSGGRIVSASRDGELSLGTIVDSSPEAFGPFANLYELERNPDASFVVSARPEPGSTRLPETILDLVPSPDGERLLIVSGGRRGLEGGATRLWRPGEDCAEWLVEGGRGLFDATDGTPRRAPPGHFGSVTAACFAPDGERILTGSADGTARVWTIDGSAPAVVLPGHEGGVVGVRFSPLGDRVLTWDGSGCLRLWHAGVEQQPVVLARRGIDSAEFGARGEQVIARTGNRVLAWGITWEAALERLRDSTNEDLDVPLDR